MADRNLILELFAPNYVPPPDEPVSSDLDTSTPERLLQKALRGLKRCMVSRDALLSTEEVVEVLGGRRAEVVQWLRTADVVPVPHPTNRRVYLYGEILEALKEDLP